MQLPLCDEHCQLNCSVAVPYEVRWGANDRFKAMASADDPLCIAQNAYLTTCVEVQKPSQRRKMDDPYSKEFEQTVDFWLGDDIKVKVCMLFFVRTLGTPAARLMALLRPHTFRWFCRQWARSNGLPLPADDDDDDNGYDDDGKGDNYDDGDGDGGGPQRSYPDFVLNSR